MKWMRLDWFNWLKKVALFSYYYILARLFLAVFSYYFYQTPDSLLPPLSILLYMLWGLFFNQIYVTLKSIKARRVFFAAAILIIIISSLDKSDLLGFIPSQAMHFLIDYLVFLLGVRSTGFSIDHYDFLQTVKVYTILLMAAFLFFGTSAAGKAVIPVLIAYIFSSLILLAILNLEKLQKASLKGHLADIQKKWIFFSFIISLIVVIATGLIYGLYNPVVFQKIWSDLSELYSAVVHIIITILTPVFYVITYIILSACNLVLRYSHHQEPARPIEAHTINSLANREVHSNLPVSVHVILAALIFLFLITILVVLLKMALRVYVTNRQGDVNEERESVFAWEEVKGGLSARLKRFTISHGYKKLRNNNPANKIRNIYIELLKIAEKAGYKREPGETAREYGKSLAAAFKQVNEDEIGEITDIYELARYNPLAVTEREAKKTETIAMSLLRNNLS